MALFGSRKTADSAPGESKRSVRGRSSSDTVEDMRRRARHRLIGACVLVLAGVVVFPMLFDTQPRPIPVVAQVEIPGVESAAPLVVPSAVADGAPAASPTSDSAALPPSVVVAAAPAVVTAVASATQAGRTESVAQSAARNAQRTEAAPAPAPKPPAPAPTPKPTPKPEPKPAPKPEPRATTQPAAPKPAPAKPAEKPVAAPKPAATPPAPVAAPVVQPPPVKPASVRNDEAARARALLEGRPSEPPRQNRADQGRFIVQVGAYTDAAKAQEVRAQIEMLGLRTYTQVAQTPTGRATRVRVGPFNSRADADKAAARISGAKLPSVILTL
ncbi:DedD protein [Lampropedia hyalina DSM 16112]|jgi:DedD protein|uniref:DedD protein n=1 Tax=Lampropedia hyalina DSM 16112 TaxID=1122156 RepID=A0A1M4Z3R6_9BURK|nr:SPOR domain-containing protein [Lampropedia hyalina]SHF12704.1 DedD protein [Lampropedia hyalina DSM 16112]